MKLFLSFFLISFLFNFLSVAQDKKRSVKKAVSPISKKVKMKRPPQKGETFKEEHKRWIEEREKEK